MRIFFLNESIEFLDNKNFTRIYDRNDKFMISSLVA